MVRGEFLGKAQKDSYLFNRCYRQILMSDVIPADVVTFCDAEVICFLDYH